MKISRSPFLLIAFVLMFCVASCTENHLNDISMRLVDERVEWEILPELSRAVINADGSGYFEEGDTIIVYAHSMTDGRVRPYVLRLENGRWLPDIYWAELGKDVQFTAWHVTQGCQLYQTGQTSHDYLHTLATNQHNEGYRYSDLLMTQVRAQAGEKVRLHFGHALSRLHIVLESDDDSYTSDQLQQAEIEVYTPCQISFNLSDATSYNPSGYQWITPMRQLSNIRTALVCPQKTDTLRTQGWIRVRIDGQESIVQVPETLDGKPFECIEAGKEIIYRLHIRKKAIANEFAGTTQWVYGIKEPVEGQWNSDHTQLAWTEGCGWFDCNKTNPSGITLGSDGLMCWAAATSNLLHWWLQQNSGTEAVKAYTGPQAVPADMLHSEIFQLYKTHFSNQGNYPLKAVNWFFNGVFQNRIYDTDPVDPAAGFFRTQLGIRSLGKEYVGTDMERDRFNAIIKQALSSQQGIMFVINMGKWSTHAVTLWGVSFDDTGLVDTLYMVDNNDGRYDTRGTIRVIKVQYLPYSGSNPELYPYVPNSLGDFTIRIESLCTVSLGRDWVK